MDTRNEVNARNVKRSFVGWRARAGTRYGHPVFESRARARARWRTPAVSSIRVDATRRVNLWSVEFRNDAFDGSRSNVATRDPFRLSVIAIEKRGGQRRRKRER